jgi:hypothetical protein
VVAAESPELGGAVHEVVESRRGPLLTVTEVACCRSYRWVPSGGEVRVRLQRAQWDAQAEAETVG